MRGELLAAWPYVWSEIWVKLYESKGTPIEMFSELYVALMPKPKRPVQPPPPTSFDDNGEMNDIYEIAARDGYEQAMLIYNAEKLKYEEAMTASPDRARKWLLNELGDTLLNENDAIGALGKAYELFDEIGGEDLSGKFFGIVKRFIEKFNLRYELRPRFELSPTLSGIFTQLLAHLKKASEVEPQLEILMNEFEESFQDLRAGQTPTRIKSCLSRQVNFLESLGGLHPNVTANTFGQVCNQVGTWPHKDLIEVAKKIYGFTCDYPGIRHGGTLANQIRDLDLRDVIAVSILMAGVTPYLTDRINLNSVYEGIPHQ